jgi:hypothetical protein
MSPRHLNESKAQVSDLLRHVSESKEQVQYIPEASERKQSTRSRHVSRHLSFAKIQASGIFLASMRNQGTNLDVSHASE